MLLQEEGKQVDQMLQSMMQVKDAIDTKMQASKFTLFSDGNILSADDIQRWGPPVNSSLFQSLFQTIPIHSLHPATSASDATLNTGHVRRPAFSSGALAEEGDKSSSSESEEDEEMSAEDEDLEEDSGLETEVRR